MIELRRIHQAVTLAKHRNFARAARALGVTQPALTRSIQALEEELGVRLFDRMPRDVVPTEFGRVLLGRGEPLLGAVQELRAEMDRLRGLESGGLSLGAGPALETGLVGPVLGRFATKHPRIPVRLVVEDSGALTRALKAGEIEMFVAYSGEAAGDPALDVITLGEHRGAFYSRPDHPLAGAGRIGLRQILEFPVAGPRIPATLLRRVLRSSGIPADGPPPLPTIECGSFFAARSMVRAGAVIGYAPVPVIAADLRAGRLVELDFPLGGLQGPAGIVQLRGHTPSSAAAELIQELRSTDRDMGSIRRP